MVENDSQIFLSTSEAAKNRFSPEDRGCYFKDEMPLKYLPSKMYRYEMSNCLFEAAYEEVAQKQLLESTTRATFLVDFEEMQLYTKLPCFGIQREAYLLSWISVDLHE